MNRNPKGWTSPANLALTLVSFRLPQASVDELAAVAEATGLPRRKVIAQAITDFAVKHNPGAAAQNPAEFRAISSSEASALIRASDGRPFSCTFTKADGTRRDMRCRFDVVEPLKPDREHRTTDALIVVWDDEKRGYRSIPVDRLLELRIDGETRRIE